MLFVVSSKMSCKNWKGRVQRIWKWYLPICIIPSQCYQPDFGRYLLVSRNRVWNLPDNRRKFAISCRLDFPTMKFQIFCIVWIIIILMLTLNVSSQTPVCNFYISSNICDWSNVTMPTTSFSSVLRHCKYSRWSDLKSLFCTNDVIYHPFPINSQYL